MNDHPTSRNVEIGEKIANLASQSGPIPDFLLRCAQLMQDDCNAAACGIVDLRSLAITHCPTSYAANDDRRALNDFVLANAGSAASYSDSQLATNGKADSNLPLGSLLYIPIFEVGRSFQASDVFTADTAQWGAPCHFANYAIFLAQERNSEKQQAFGETDQAVCFSAIKEIAQMLRSKRAEAMQSLHEYYLSTASTSARLEIEYVLHQIQQMLPAATALSLAVASRSATVSVEIAAADEVSSQVAPEVIEHLMAAAQLIYSEEESESFPQDARLLCSSHMRDDGQLVLLFRFATMLYPLRFYILEVVTTHLHLSETQILYRFFHDLFQDHQIKDSMDERVSVLAQMRHAVLNPIAAAANIVDTMQRHMRLAARSEQTWLRLRDDRDIRQLLPQAFFLANQALLYLNSGRFLFSSLSRGTIRFDQYRPTELFYGVKTAFEYGLHERGQVLTTKIVGEQTRSAVGDRALLWIMLANLIDNAIKYGHRGTRVVATLTLGRDYWTFSIENTGDLLPGSLSKEIFRPFARATALGSELRRRHGTGLGLSVARMILRAHSEYEDLSYSSSLISENNRATTRFQFRLPYRLSSRGVK